MAIFSHNNFHSVFWILNYCLDSPWLVFLISNSTAFYYYNVYCSSSSGGSNRTSSSNLPIVSICPSLSPKLFCVSLFCWLPVLFWRLLLLLLPLWPLIPWLLPPVAHCMHLCFVCLACVRASWIPFLMCLSCSSFVCWLIIASAHCACLDCRFLLVFLLVCFGDV